MATNTFLDLKPEQLRNLMETLSPEEQDVIKQILTEYAETGKSKTYETVWKQDYEEIPVDIDTFLESDEYLGTVTDNGKQIYPFWRERLREIFANGDTEFTEIVFSGAIGIGKTQIAVYALDYLLYRLLCLRNPQKYFGFAETDEIAIFCFNATVALAMGVGYSRIHATCLKSPWFMTHGTQGGSDTNPYYIPNKHITIKAGSKASHGLGQQIFAAFLDEVNFAPGQNATLEKSKIMQTYTSITARIKSRFIKNGKLLGKMFMVSSKHAESDFLEVYIEKRKTETDAATMYLVDEPLWVVKPSTTYSGLKFKVAYGAKQLMPQIVGPDDDEESLKHMGFSILEVPIEFEADFKFNIVTALQDLAGIALPGALNYFNYKVFSKCYVDTPSPFTAEVLQIGLDDHMEYEEFFNFDVIPVEIRNLPIAIHVDTALKHDLLGMSAVAYLRNIVEDSDDGLVEKRVYAHVFSVGIQAPPGSEISLAKTRRFIYKLRALGLNIVVVSTDTFQSAEFHQILRDKGFETAIRSLDRTPEGYQILREAMLENRISLIRHGRLENELIHLQRDTITGKLDHPANGCFTSDTKIRLTDGRSLSIEELISEQGAGKSIEVYTKNCATGKTEHKKIRSIFPTKLASELVLVLLSNGATIRCTPEHRFMLVDGSFVEIQKLCSDTALMTPDGKDIRISSIVRIPYLGLVYDLEIEDNHNFTLDAGVVVHNSKDISDSLAGAVWDLSLIPYEPGLSNFRLELGGPKEEEIPAFTSMFRGMKPLDKYNFERAR